MRRSRNACATLFGLIAVFGVLFSTVGIWANRTLYDSQAFSRAVDHTLSDRQVTDALAHYATNQVFANIDVETRLQSVLPRRTKSLAPTISAQIKANLGDVLADELAKPSVRAQVVKGAEQSHRALMQLMDKGKIGNASINDGEVQLNLLPLIPLGIDAIPSNPLTRNLKIPALSFGGDHSVQLAELSKAFGQPLPNDFGLITVYQGERVARGEVVLAQMQQALVTFRRYFALLLIATAACLIASIAVSANRLRAVQYLFLGGLVAFGLGSVLVRQAVRRAPLIAIEPANRQAIRIMVTTLSQGLLWAFNGALVVCVLACGGTWLVGRFRPVAPRQALVEG